MHRQADVLQDRVEIAPFGRRVRDAGEGVRCEEDEEIERAGDPGLHRQSVRLQNVRNAFGTVIAVNDLSVEFAAGTMTAVLGPSGCGKTTTLNLIAGFERPDAGMIYFGDHVVAAAARAIATPTHKRNLGMVFQSYALWPHLNVGDNVAFGLKMRNVPRPERDAAV